MLQKSGEDSAVFYIIQGNDCLENIFFSFFFFLFKRELSVTNYYTAIVVYYLTTEFTAEVAEINHHLMRILRITIYLCPLSS